MVSGADLRKNIPCRQRCGLIFPVSGVMLVEAAKQWVKAHYGSNAGCVAIRNLKPVWLQKWFLQWPRKYPFRNFSNNRKSVAPASIRAADAIWISQTPDWCMSACNTTRSRNVRAPTWIRLNSRPTGPVRTTNAGASFRIDRFFLSIVWQVGQVWPVWQNAHGMGRHKILVL